ncbi:hypothetical protein [Cetobacterium sp.]|uniref:hypothetical protein n=1 Tax=Cetobacterium sp. TaxID=2071632 RepID=UPI003F2AFB34
MDKEYLRLKKLFLKANKKILEKDRGKGEVKTIYNERTEVIKVNCGLIVHSRGERIMQDNLIAIEMKKIEQPFLEKEEDRIKLSCLTKDSFNNNV